MIAVIPLQRSKRMLHRFLANLLFVDISADRQLHHAFRPALSIQCMVVRADHRILWNLLQRVLAWTIHQHGHIVGVVTD